MMEFTWEKHKNYRYGDSFQCSTVYHFCKVVKHLSKDKWYCIIDGLFHSLEHDTADSAKKYFQDWIEINRYS